MTQYTVVRYVPDTFAGEFINIGVLAWGEGRVLARFVGDWERARAFGEHGVEELQRFAERFSPGAEAPSESEVADMVDAWGGAVQFSPALASRRTPEATLDLIAREVLRGHSSPEREWMAGFTKNPSFIRKHTLLPRP